MKKFIIRLSVFVALLLALDRAIYYGAVYLRDNGPSEGGLNLIYGAHQNPPLVFFGSSQTLRAYDLRIIERETGLNAYDFARDGSSVEQHLFTLSEYLATGHKPGVVVFEAGDSNVIPNALQFDKNLFDAYRTATPGTLELFYGGGGFGNRFNEFLVTRVMRSAIFSNRLLNLIVRWKNRDDPSYSCRHLYFQCQEFYHGSVHTMDGPGPAKATGPAADLAFDPARMAIFEQVARLAEIHGFLLILAATPTFDEDDYIGGPMRARLDDFFCAVAQRHPMTVYTRLSHVQNLDRRADAYMDTGHLNTLGAGIYSAAFAEIVSEVVKGGGERCILR